MFTGLIQAIGQISQHESRGGDVRLRIATGALPMHDVCLGESIAVSGVCLTVVEFEKGARVNFARDCAGDNVAASPAKLHSGPFFSADVSNETLALTTLGKLEVGATVNLERALQLGDRLGGHLVSGHVDGVGVVECINDDGRSQRWRFAAPKPLLRYIAHKGSVAIDGVSLTVNAVDETGFEVNLVPHTIDHTTFKSLRVGDAINIEVDQVARYVERLNATREWV